MNYNEARRDGLCGVETTPGNRCLLAFAHHGRHLDRDALAEVVGDLDALVALLAGQRSPGP